MPLPNVHFPRNFGYKAWNMDPMFAQNLGIVPNFGDLHLARLSINAPIQSKVIRLAVALPSFELSQGACFAGLYDVHGNLIANTDDISQAFDGARIIKLPLEMPAILEPGAFFVGLLLNGTKAPLLWTAQTNLAMLPSVAGQAVEFFDIIGPFVELPQTIDYAQMTNGTLPYFTALQ